VYRQFETFDVQGAISRIFALIGVRCFRSSVPKNVDLFNVGGEAVESFFSFMSDGVMFEREVYFHQGIIE